jgi:selenocysteine lyase/cysteine desulfurase
VVLISNLEHHSNDLPWRAVATVKRIGLTSDGGIDIKDYEAMLLRYSGCVKLVAISGASNVTGHTPDIHWFAKKAHDAGAQILVDAAQLAAHRPIRMNKLKDPEHLDYVAISGHKMYAPFGSGALIGRRDTFMRGEPEYRGGGTISFVSEDTVDWATPPDSDEAGSPNVIGAIAMAKAAKQLQAINLQTIADKEAELTSYALRQLSDVPGLVIYGDKDPSRAHFRSSVIPFTMQDMPSHLVASILGFEWGIGVRSGCFCAHPYMMNLLKIDKQEQLRIRQEILHSKRDAVPGMVRISFGLYNNRKEIDRLILALRAIAHKKFGKYKLDVITGFYTPVDNNEDYSEIFKI